MKLRQLVCLFLLSMSSLTSPAVASDSLVVTFHEACEGAKSPESLAGIATVLGKMAVGGVIDWVGAMAKAQGEDKSFEIGFGTGGGEFYKIMMDGQVRRSPLCLSVVLPGRGKTQANTPDAAQVMRRMHEVLEIADDQLTVPDFYADFDIISIPGRQDMFALKMTSLYLGRSNISSWSNQQRSLALSIRFSLPSAPDKPFASALFRFADIDIGKFFSREKNPLFRSTSGLMLGPTFSQAEEIDLAAAKSMVAARTAYEEEAKKRAALAETADAKPEPEFSPALFKAVSEYCAGFSSGGAAQPADMCPPSSYVSASHRAYLRERFLNAKLMSVEQEELPSFESEKRIGLVNATVKVDETRTGSAFWAAIASAYDSQNADLKKAVAAHFIPSERRSIEAAAADAKIKTDNADDDLYIAYVEAQLAVEEAAAGVSTLGTQASAIDLARARAELIKAKITANKAARSASVLPLPYPELVH
ncbi:hypothetical protein [Janthinobacterium sp. NKUCC08_JDC]|uniref:hypothetical protein n=1 Tax=Janthinobacterium sp. NKUCC08_JDC TaxID=2842122 RepID=UPI001C5BE949|nr:hypothetical protein [Janthinobacterium sp. NKUCC08_JDC]MBW3499902.1 hypothetical protein [Janthinobacterium sp. NKUCC08_JDC]